MVWSWRPNIAEMRWALSWEAVVAGVVAVAIWVGLDGLYPSLNDLLRSICPVLEQFGLKNWCPKSAAAEILWNPHAEFGSNSGLAWLFISIRLLGSTLVVPPLEEVFYRSFLYRYISEPRFQNVPLGQFSWGPFLITAAIFGLSHREWLAGILCGAAYQALVCRRERLGDAMTAHAITNFLLGLWVVGQGAWKFW